MPKIANPPVPTGETFEAARAKTAISVFRVDGTLQRLETDFYIRAKLPLDTPFDGPAVILQTDTTTVIPPGWTAVLDKGSNLILTANKKG